MRSRVVRLVAVLAMVALTGFTPDTNDATVADATLAHVCVAGTPQAAATELLGNGAELVEVDRDSALVLTPGVHPGVRNRLVSVDGSWCTAEGLNLALDATDAVDAASTAATYLPAAHFDEVTVLDATEVTPGVVELTTHARTNGVVADWTIQVDALGIHSATWRAIDFAVEPFDPQIEGLTALPGAEWTYVRTATGLLESSTTVEEIAALNGDPSPFISVETKDGFTIHVHESDAMFWPQAAHTIFGVDLPRPHIGVAPDAGQDTGITQVDFLRIMGEAAQINADDFHDWGWRKGWVDDEGSIYVDGALSAFCLACVLVSEHFNVHMNRAVVHALDALGYSYPDARLALINVVGHEMVHNYQNSYGKPDSVGGGRHNSYSEGMARFSETLHNYSHISHQPDSLVYANNINGCNGWQGSNADAAFASGPLTGQSYDACYFWMTVHAAHGIGAFLGMLQNSEGLPGGRPWEIYAGAIEAATGVPPAETIANFAAMTLTGRDYTWGNPTDPESEEHDWAEYLDRWRPSATAAVGDTLRRSMRDGGVGAWRFSGTAVVDVSDGEGHAAAVVVDDGTTTSIDMLADGDRIEVGGASAGWILLINTSTDSSEVTVSLNEP